MQVIEDIQDRGGCSYGKIILQCLLKWMQPKVVVEIGVQFGDTTAHLCEGAKNSGIVYGFDVWDTHGLWNQFQQAGSLEEVSQTLKELGYTNFELFKVNTTTQEFKDILATKCHQIDFAFIDGCHSYTGLHSDFDNIYPKLSPTGIIAFHDTKAIDGCREFILDLRTKYWDGSFDIIELPYGTAQRRVGWAYLVKRQHNLGHTLDEICGSVSSPEELYTRERNWLQGELNKC